MIEWGVFDDQASDYSQSESLDYGFVTRADAERELESHRDLFGEHAYVHEVEEIEDGSM